MMIDTGSAMLYNYIVSAFGGVRGCFIQSHQVLADVCRVSHHGAGSL